jgi:hypothetical protein
MLKKTLRRKNKRQQKTTMTIIIKEAAISILRFLPEEHCFLPCPSMRIVYSSTNNSNNYNNQEEDAHILHVNLEVSDDNIDVENECMQQYGEQESSSKAWWRSNDSVSGLSLDLVLPRPSAAWMNEYQKWNYFGRNGIGHPVFSTSRELRDFNEKGRALIRSLIKELAPAPFMLGSKNDRGGGGGVRQQRLVVVTVDDFLDLYNLQVGDWVSWWHIRDLNYPGLVVPIQQLPVSFELKSRLMMWRGMIGCNIQLFYHNQQYIESFNRQGQILQRLIRQELSGTRQCSIHDGYDPYGYGLIQSIGVSIDHKNVNGMMMAAKVGLPVDDDGDVDYMTSDTSNYSSCSSSDDSMTLLCLECDELSRVESQDPVILDTITTALPSPPVSGGNEDFSTVLSVGRSIQAMSI